MTAVAWTPGFPKMTDLPSLSGGLAKTDSPVLTGTGNGDPAAWVGDGAEEEAK